jgi:3-deoxy-D-arabino-heptulosonate 7-phosphate (DAHP) synthase class II
MSAEKLRNHLPDLIRAVQREGRQVSDAPLTVNNVYCGMHKTCSVAMRCATADACAVIVLTLTSAAVQVSACAELS